MTIYKHNLVTVRQLLFAIVVAFFVFTLFNSKIVYAAPAPATPSQSEWQSFIEALMPLGERVVNKLPDDAAENSQLRHEIYRKLFASMAQGYFGLMHADPKYPDFIPYFNQVFNSPAVNPDTVYYQTPLDDDGVYKISGYRNNVRQVNFTVASGLLIPRGTGSYGPTLADYNIDDLTIDKTDGSFEVILSPSRPENHSGDWWPLHAGATYMLVRQMSYDWLNEVDARLAIERLDMPAIKPRQTVKEIQENLLQISVWAQSKAANWLNRSNNLVNTIIMHDLKDIGGVGSQQYYEGSFIIADDEALILETAVPKECDYWGIQLVDPLWVSIDYLHRQSNLNGFTAALSADGKFRAVISATDPGVPNWLDTAAYSKGYIQGRWTACSSYHTPTLTKVKLSDLRKHLPQETPVISPAVRDKSIRLRRKGAQLRRRW